MQCPQNESFIWAGWGLSIRDKEVATLLLSLLAGCCSKKRRHILETLEDAVKAVFDGVLQLLGALLDDAGIHVAALE